MTQKIDNLIKDLAIVSEAERDRKSIQSIRSLNLVDFIDAQLQKATCENELKVLVSRRLKEALQSEDIIDLSTLAHILMVVNKTDNEFVLGLINAVKDFYQIEKESEKGNNSGGEGNGLTAEDIRAARKTYRYLKEISDAEFPEGDKKE